MKKDEHAECTMTAKGLTLEQQETFRNLIHGNDEKKK